MHTLLDLRGPIPTFVEITDVNIPDMKILDLLIPEPGSFYIMDRGYFDFKRLYNLDQAKSFFVVRSKIKYLFKRLYSQKVDTRSDQIITLTGRVGSTNYPDKLRRITFLTSSTRHPKSAFLLNDIVKPLLFNVHF